MSVGEVKAGLVVADANVMMAAEIADGIGYAADTTNVLGIAEIVEEIPRYPAAMVPARFEDAASWLAARTIDVGVSYAVGRLVDQIDTTRAAYEEPLTGADHTQPPVSDIFGGLDSMASESTKLAEGQNVFREGADAETAALYAAAATVRSQLSQQDYESLAGYLHAEVRERTTAIRDKVEPARAILKPIADGIIATASTVKDSSQQYAARLG